MGRAQYLLQKDVKKEIEEAEEKAKKRGLWGSIGGKLGGLAAGLFTGGAASPLMAALAIGGGAYAGGKAGHALAKRKYGAMEGGKFLSGTRAEMESTLGGMAASDAMTGAMYAGGFQALRSMGGVGKLFEKGALKEKGGITGLLTRPAGEVTGIYKNTLLGRLGRGLDVKGSLAGKGWQKVLERGYEKKGWIDPDLQPVGGTESGKKIIAIDRRKYYSGQEEPIQERISGGADPDPRGPNLWSRAKKSIKERYEKHGFGMGIVDPFYELREEGGGLDPTTYQPEKVDFGRVGEKQQSIDYLPETPKIQYKTKGLTGKAQRFLPGGASGWSNVPGYEQEGWFKRLFGRYE